MCEFGGGVGDGQVACVLMFHLLREEFPVDTHVSYYFLLSTLFFQSIVISF